MCKKLARLLVTRKGLVCDGLQSPYLENVNLLTEVEGHDLQGQRFATLASFLSEPSDENGMAVFTNLTILGTSRYPL